MGDTEAAAAYWSDRSVGAFSRERDWMGTLAGVVAGHGSSVLEFGCNVGRHLLLQRSMHPDATLMGIDVNLRAVQQARRAGLFVLLGDEQTLQLLPGRSFDVALTVSVLDHLPDPTKALLELDRIGGTLVLLEPWLGSEQQVQDTRHSPWTYSWDYQRRLPHRRWEVMPLPLRPQGVGPHYQLHIGT